MNFGFGIGDFVTLFQLAQKIWKEFSDAPSQYQAIALEVENVCHVLQEIGEYVERNGISDSQQGKLYDIIAGVFKVLNDTEKAITKRSSLESRQIGLKGRAKRIWARVIFEPDEIRDLRQRIISNLTVLNTFVSAFGRENVAKLAKNQDQQEIRNILDWLAPCDYAAQHSSHLGRCLDKTGQWMLGSSEFQTWVKDGDCKGLLLQAIPGTGKTILTAIIIDYLQNLHDSNDKVGICYYYCDYKRQDIQDENDGSRKDSHELDQVLLRLLRQLIETSSWISPNLQNLYNKHQKFSTRVALDDVRTTFHSYAKSFDKVYVIVDALDECETVNGYRRALLAELAGLSEIHNIRVMITSRPLLGVANALCGFQAIEIKASNEDVGRYVEFNISKLPNFVAKDVDLQHEIKDAIIASADGIFLLATLHVQSLKGKKSPGALRKALKSFGTGTSAYAKAYDKTMKRIAGQIEDQKELAMETLMWIIYAQRPLKTPELLHALATEIDKSTFDQDDIPDIEDVLSACCGLVIVEQESEIVRLVHRTAQEFFQDSGCTWLTGAHSKLSRTCITYLSFMDLVEGVRRIADTSYRDRLVQYPLWDYASWYWQYHTELQEVSMSVEEFAAKQEQIDASSQALMEYTIPGYLELCRQHPGVIGLYLLAKCGVTSLIPSFLKNHDINAKDKHQQSPISYAVQGDHLDTVSLLIKAGAHLDGLYDMKASSLFSESKFQDEPFFDHREHLLLWSIQSSHHMAELLINGGARLDVVDTMGRNPLHLAVGCRRELLIGLLLEKGLDPSKMDLLRRTPLIYAIQRRCVSGIELLLTKNTHMSFDDSVFAHSTYLSKMDKDEKTQLFKTADSKGKFYTMLWLLKSGVQTNMSHNTILLRAVWKDNSFIAALLIKNGADVNFNDPRGRTALMIAVGHPTKDMAVLLLANGARVNDLDYEGRSALSWAVDKSSEDEDVALVSLLLDYGADPKIRCNIGRTPLEDAIIRDNTATVRVLLSRGVYNSSSIGADDMKIYKPSSWSALHWACRRGSYELVMLLIDAGIKGSTVSTVWPSASWTPLDIACFSGNKELVNRIEATTRQDPSYPNLIASGIIIADKMLTADIVAARANDLTVSQNNDSLKWCSQCSKDGKRILPWDPYRCFMCKYEEACAKKARILIRI